MSILDYPEEEWTHDQILQRGRLAAEILNDTELWDTLERSLLLQALGAGSDAAAIAALDRVKLIASVRELLQIRVDNAELAAR